MFAATATDMNPKLIRERRQAPLQRADHARSNPCPLPRQRMETRTGGKSGAAARRGHNDGRSLRSSPRRGGSCDLPATLAPAPHAGDHAHLSPLLPRGRLRFMFHEYRWHELAGLHTIYIDRAEGALMTKALDFLK